MAEFCPEKFRSVYVVKVVCGFLTDPLFNRSRDLFQIKRVKAVNAECSLARSQASNEISYKI